MRKIILGENLEALAELPDAFAQLVYEFSYVKFVYPKPNV